MSSLILLIAILLLIWFWFDGMKAGEKAVSSAKNACERMGLQLLDETVMLKSLGIRSLLQGSGFTRKYEFEYCDGNNARHKSYLILKGKTILEIGFFNTPDKIVKFPSTKKASNDK